MKRILLLLTIACCIAAESYGQTVAQWQADLRHLQKVVHSKYDNLFHTITADDWDKAVDKFYKEIPSMDKTTVIAGFTKLVSLFHIGHTQVNNESFHGQNAGAGSTLKRYPYQLYWFSDGLYVVATDKQYEKAVGGKVIRMGKMKTEEAWEAIKPLVAYENEQGLKSNGVHFLAVPEFLKIQGVAESDQELPLVVSKDGKEEKILFKAAGNSFPVSVTGISVPEGWAIARKNTGEPPLWQKDPNAYRYYEYLPASKTLYVRHSVTLNDGDKTISNFFKGIVDFIDNNDVQKLVLDIRTNGGGNNYLNKNIITSIITSRKINEKGKFFCIIGRRTFSAAQNLVNELEKYTEVIFVGEPTSENVNFYGDTRTEVLPNSQLSVNLSWMWWQNLDPRDKRKATSPQLAADMSFSDYYNNVDPALQLAMSYDPSKSLLTGLSNLLKQGKKEDALRFAEAYKKDPVNKYFTDRIEPDINNEGYRLMQAGKNEQANALFEVNMKLFPESANTYDSYAESLAKMGKIEEAIKYYEKAIEKDKSGETAENAKKMIENLKHKKGF